MITLFITQLIITGLMWMFMFMLSFKKKSNNKTLSPFECGYNSNQPKMPLLIQFTMLMFMFLLFDIELSILISSSWKMEKMNKSWVSTMFAFLLLMTISVVYEMTKKSFKWN